MALVEKVDNFRFHNFMKKMGRGVRSNLYAVEVTVPPAISVVGDFNERFRFMCKATSAPSFTMGQAEAPFLGRVLKLDGDRVFDDWTTEILMSQDFDVRNTLEKWSDAIDGTVNHDTSVDPNEIEYFGVADVMQLDKNGKVIKAYQLEGIWPKEIGQVDLAYDSNDQIATFQVTWAVNWVESPSTTRNNITTM